VTDIAIVWDPGTSTGDWALSGNGVGDLLTSNELDTPLMVSVFSDRVATAGFVPPDGSGDPRGWWADTYNAAPIGSNIWQDERGVISSVSATLQNNRSWGQAATAWMTKGGYAQTVTVTASYLGNAKLGLGFVIVKPGATTPQSLSYAWPVGS